PLGSQHTAHPDTPAGRRYTQGTSRVLLFVRERQTLANGLAEPFVFLGRVSLRAWKGERSRMDRLTEPLLWLIVQLYHYLRRALDITADTSAIMAVVLNEFSKPKLLQQTRGAEMVSAPTLPWEVGNSLSALFKRKRIDLDQAR